MASTPEEPPVVYVSLVSRSVRAYHFIAGVTVKVGLRLCLKVFEGLQLLMVGGYQRWYYGTPFLATNPETALPTHPSIQASGNVLDFRPCFFGELDPVMEETHVAATKLCSM